MNDILQKETEMTIDSVPEPENIEDVIYSLMVNPNLSSINYFNDFGETPLSPESIGNIETDEVGVFDLDSNGTKMAMSTHAFHHHLQNDPQKATEILVSRAARKMLCMGIKPVAISAFLYHIDFANPNGQSLASGAKKGLENATQKFNLKISDRKMRFDHFSGHGPVPPTMIISTVGKVDNKETITTHSFKNKGNNIFIIGKPVEDIGSSEYLEFYHGLTDSPLPHFNMDDELKIHSALNKLHELNLITSASPVGKGGLFFTLLRAAIPNNLGFDITTIAESRIDSFLFGEAMGRIIVEVETEKEDDFVDVLSGLN
ncbi:MAG TPA: AIR synthase-related protein, partial [Prolixibacteraceae bacterium]|nr:AIR synthase-related protein [Prolixibacteraceae bacterium]